jgi:hypothetical protein
VRLPACAPVLLSGIVDCGKQVVNEEGIRALWKGLTPFATHLTLKYALRMGSNSMYQVGGQWQTLRGCAPLGV